MKNYERRIFNGPVEIRASEDGKKQFITGYAAVFNTLSEPIYGLFQEKIDPKAFDTVIKNCDCRALVNHDASKILGRTKSGTCRLFTDERGLRYEVDPPDTSYCRDLMVSMSRGDINQSSFQFNVEESEWDETGEMPIRTIKRFSELLDVSPVTFPAFSDTTSGMTERNAIPAEIRSKLDEIAAKKAEEIRKSAQTETTKAELALLELRRKRLNYL